MSKSKKKIVESVHKQEIRLLWSSESFEGKYNIVRPGIDCRIASLFTRYLTAIGIIPESLTSIGQF